MEPSSAPNLPTPHLNNVKTEKIDYKEHHTTVLEFSYTWKVPNMRNITSRMLKSPVFSPSVNDQLKWSLLLYPFGTGWNGQLITGQECLSLYLCLEHSNKPEVTATFKFSILNSAGGKQNYVMMKKPWTFKHGTTQATYGYARFISKYEVDRNYLNNSSNQIFTIVCEIKVYATIDSFSEKNKGIPLTIPNSRLLNDIEILFKNQKYTDFRIIVDEQEFPVHRAILAARSSVFAAMLEYDTVGQKNNRVDITDTSPEVVKEMLCFIYTGKVNAIEKVAFDLLSAANKYALDRLKIMCEEALRKSLAIKNAAETLIHADLHGADLLKSEAIKFINMHTIAIMDTKGFKLMIASHPYLVAETLHALALHQESQKVQLYPSNPGHRKNNRENKGTSPKNYRQ